MSIDIPLKILDIFSKLIPLIPMFTVALTLTGKVAQVIYHKLCSKNNNLKEKYKNGLMIKNLLEDDKLKDLPEFYKSARVNQIPRCNNLNYQFIKYMVDNNYSQDDLFVINDAVKYVFPFYKVNDCNLVVSSKKAKSWINHPKAWTISLIICFTVFYYHVPYL
ncbi:hypothetical protein PT286_07695 [Neisseriaceae bacterium ESL0693]|nr:hypothetical protein [Neisseriaceae bacterium ESL0693]